MVTGAGEGIVVVGAGEGISVADVGVGVMSGEKATVDGDGVIGGVSVGETVGDLVEPGALGRVCAVVW